MKNACRFRWMNYESLLRALAAIDDPANEIVVSAACAWEIATNHRLGKLGIPGATENYMRLLAIDGFSELAITQAHGLRAGSYTMPHGDPFDRMLAAQSELEAAPLVSRDPALAAVPCTLIW
jgi:PIN domain nuclease of toxin-antitoxin system